MSVRDLVEEFVYLGIHPLSARWLLSLGELPRGSKSLLLPFVVSSNVELPRYMVRPCRKYIGPLTKDEFEGYSKLQEGKKQNRVLAALGLEIPIRVYPEKHPPSQNKKRKRKERTSSDDNGDENSSEGEDVSCDASARPADLSYVDIGEVETEGPGIDVLASAATVIEKEKLTSAVSKGSRNPKKTKKKLSPHAIQASPARIVVDIDDSESTPPTRRDGKDKDTRAHSEPFIATPSPELIEDVLGGFTKRCALDGTWLMGLPDFDEEGETSHRGPNICLSDLKYRNSLNQIGNEFMTALIQPELEKEFTEENDPL
uniref:Uncharacterized protein n=1 Tax=Oryza punctata TaxID=4537 RepID=A0A0E0JJ37_ORYPU